MAKRKTNMKGQVWQILVSMLALRIDKQLAKKDGSIRDKILSVTTFKLYVTICKRFVDYCKKKHNCKTLEDCQDYIEEFLTRGCKNGKSYSARTIKSLTPRQVADLLGHSTSQITEMYYVKKDTRRLAGVTDGFEL